MSSCLFLLPAVVQAFAPYPSAHFVQTAPHGRGCPAGSRAPLMVATSLPNLARLAERSSPPETVVTHAPPPDFVTAFRQAAASRGVPTSSTLRRSMAQSVVQSSPSGLEAAAAGASSLEIVTDANFGEAVLAASKRGPVLLEFYGEYCGPCRQCEPALKQLDASFAELKVVKARLNSNPAIEDWLLAEGLKVSKLPLPLPLPLPSLSLSLHVAVHARVLGARTRSDEARRGRGRPRGRPRDEPLFDLGQRPHGRRRLRPRLLLAGGGQPDGRGALGP